MGSGKQVTIEDLAVMIKKGFDSVDERFNKVEKELKELRAGQEDIVLRLDNVAYRFELNELKQRVFVLEQKAGIA